MQIGISHLVRIAGDEAKVQVLREHLSRDHVLASELGKEDLLLKLGEAEIKMLVLERHHRRLVRAYRMLESAARVSRRTRDFEFLEASRKRFVGVALDLVEYLIGAPPTGTEKPDVGNAAGERPKNSLSQGPSRQQTVLPRTTEHGR
jgi:hypothetical protein